MKTLPDADGAANGILEDFDAGLDFPDDPDFDLGTRTGGVGGGHQGQNHIPKDNPQKLCNVAQDDFELLMSLRDFPSTSDAHIALTGFKSRWNDSPWKQKQHGWLQRACLAAASGETIGHEFCRCGLGYTDGKGAQRYQTCQKPMLCPSCNFHMRVKKAWREFVPAFDRAPYWYTLTVCWESDPDRAGLRWATEQNDKGRAGQWSSFKPWQDKPNEKPFPIYACDSPGALVMADRACDFARKLSRWLSGVFASFEWHLDFRPVSAHPQFNYWIRLVSFSLNNTPSTLL